MPTFPTLARNPNQEFSEKPEDGTIRTPMEAGYLTTRRRHIRQRNRYRVSYTLMTQADKDLLDTFIKDTSKGGAVIFDWTHPISAAVKSVRFITLPTFVYAGFALDVNTYDVSFELEEA